MRTLRREFQRILIVRTDRIGDVILTLPMAKILKRQYPSATISLLIRRYTAEIVEHHPSVDHMVYYDEGTKPLPFFRLLTQLRSGRYDAVFHTHPRFRAALLTWLAGIPIRIGTGYRWYSIFFNRKIYEHRKYAQRHELEYNLNLLQAIHCPIEKDDISPLLSIQPLAAQRVKTVLLQREVQPHHRLIILHPGSGGSARDWPPDKFGELGRRLVEVDHVRIVVTGGKQEENLVHRVCSDIGRHAIPLVDMLNLSEYAALASFASLFIANSTGPIHIAAAVGTPVIGLYSQIVPLSAARWGPYTENRLIFSPSSVPADCRRCKHNTVCECMETILVDDVYRGAMNMLSLHVPAPIASLRNNVEAA